MAIHNLLSELPESFVDDCSNPSKKADLPYPFLYDITPVDRFKLTKRNGVNYFTYFGRLAFTKVMQEINDLKKRGGYRKLFVYGTMGYGKSFILTAVTCALIYQGRRVVIPDCRALNDVNHLEYIKSGLKLAFADSESHFPRFARPNLWRFNTILRVTCYTITDNR